MGCFTPTSKFFEMCGIWDLASGKLTRDAFVGNLLWDCKSKSSQFGQAIYVCKDYIYYREFCFIEYIFLN